LGPEKTQLRERVIVDGQNHNRKKNTRGKKKEIRGGRVFIKKENFSFGGYVRKIKEGKLEGSPLVI